MRRKPSLINRNSLPFCHPRPLATPVFAAPPPAASVTKHPNFGAKLRFPEKRAKTPAPYFSVPTPPRHKKPPMTNLLPAPPLQTPAHSPNLHFALCTLQSLICNSHRLFTPSPLHPFTSSPAHPPLTPNPPCIFPMFPSTLN